MRCSVCNKYRPTLRAMRSRLRKATTENQDRSSTDASSHTNYRYLQTEGLKERLANAQKQKKEAERNCRRLREKLDAKIEEEGVSCKLAC